MSHGYEITLRAMRFHALVGILPHELKAAQPIEIDLTVTLSEGDALVDYRGLYDGTAAVLAGGHIEYLEDIADRVASSAFSVSPRVSGARVAVRKPHVSLGGPLDHAEVRIERRRSATGI